MIHAQQLREFVITPALVRLESALPYSKAADNLVFGTGLVESRYTYVDQTTLGPGPAYGLWQMEKLTYEDLWRNTIPGIKGLREKLLDMAGYDSLTVPPVTELHGNLFYAAAMCRVHYRRAKPPLPSANDALGLAMYWKQFYNTVLGAGTIEKALPSFHQAVST